VDSKAECDRLNLIGSHTWKQIGERVSFVFAGSGTTRAKTPM